MKKKTLSVAKGEHTYLFSYYSGFEDEIVGEIMRVVESDQTTLDWLDAAALSFKVAQDAAAGCYCEMNPFQRDKS